MKRIILAGGSGFVGQSLAPLLVAKSYDVVVLGRGAAHRKNGVDYLQWDGKTVGHWSSALEGAEAVVNLTGKKGMVTVTAFEVPHGRWEHAFGYIFKTRDRTIVRIRCLRSKWCSTRWRARASRSSG